MTTKRRQRISRPSKEKFEHLVEEAEARRKRAKTLLRKSVLVQTDQDLFDLLTAIREKQMRGQRLTLTESAIVAYLDTVKQIQAMEMLTGKRFPRVWNAVRTSR